MFSKIPFRDVLRRIDRLSRSHRSLRIYIQALQEAQMKGKEFDETAFLTGLALGDADTVLDDVHIE